MSWWPFRRETNWWGLGLVLLGAAQSIVATLGVELFLARTALIVTLTGVIWMVGGALLLKKLAFPLFLLCFMVPIPAIIFNKITFPLQIIASQLADGALTVLRFRCCARVIFWNCRRRSSPWWRPAAAFARCCR